MKDISQTLLTIGSDAALKAGEFILKAFRQEVAFEEKSSRHDLVTTYDREAERLIVDYIFHEYPDSTVVGEEAGARGEGAVQWYVDPIDGTTNFIAGIPFFNVSIGAAVDNQMVAGIIYDPVRRELFTASSQGAFLNSRPIQASGSQHDTGALLLTDFPYPGRSISGDDYALFAQLVEKLRVVRRLGSVALELAYVACGRADAAFSALASAWDVAAGSFILEQAGGHYRPVPGLNSDEWPPSRFVATCAGYDLSDSVLRLLLEINR